MNPPTGNVRDEEKVIMPVTKQANISDAETPSVSSGTETVTIDPVVQKKLVRKLDLYLLPWMALVSADLVAWNDVADVLRCTSSIRSTEVILVTRRLMGWTRTCTLPGTSTPY